MNRTFLQARLTSIYAQIEAYEAASLALATAGVESYTLDTGQSKQTVTRLDLEWMKETIDGLYNRASIIEQRLNGTSSIKVGPAW